MQTLKDKKHAFEEEITNWFFEKAEDFKAKNPGVLITDVRIPFTRHELYDGSGRVVKKDIVSGDATLWIQRGV